MKTMSNLATQTKQDKSSIRHWAEDDRPREKLMLKGKNALSDAELLAILIGTGSGKKSAVDLGREMLALTNGDLSDFGKLSLNQLCKLKGIGPSKAITVLAALELGRRRSDTPSKEVIKVTTSKEAYVLLNPYFKDLQHEEFYMMFLNNSGKVIQIKKLSHGGLSSTVVDLKLLFKAAFDCAANSVIVAHNHPSGVLKPSKEDIAVTKRIQEVCKLVDLNFLDHLIITDNDYFSIMIQASEQLC